MTSERPPVQALPADPPRLLGGDGLRGICALGVFLGHAAVGSYGSTVITQASVHPTGPWWEVYSWPGGVAMYTAFSFVWIFLPLSGFLISRRFVRAFVEGEPMPSLREFLRNRALRILPVFWVVWGLVMLRYGPRGASAEQILSSFTMTTDYAGHPLRAGIGQAWTLEVEVTFYALVACAAAAGAPRLGRYLGRRARLGVVIGLAALVAAFSLRRGLLGTPLPPNGHGLTVALGLFAPGVILAALQLRRRPPALTPRGRHWVAGGLVALGVGAFMLRSALGATPQAIPLVFVGAAAVLGGVYLREHVDGRPWRLLDTRAVRWVGRRAYPTYLINPPLVGSVLVLTSQNGHPVTTLAATVVVALPLTLAAAHLLHRGVEVPCLRLRARRSPERAPAGPAARGAAVAGPSA